MLFNNEDIPDIPKTIESELSPEDIKRIKRTEGLFKIKEAYHNDVELQNMIDDFICVLESGISQEEYKKRKDELNNIIHQKIKTSKTVNKMVESITESLTIFT